MLGRVGELDVISCERKVEREAMVRVRTFGDAL